MTIIIIFRKILKFSNVKRIQNNISLRLKYKSISIFSSINLSVSSWYIPLLCWMDTTRNIQIFLPDWNGTIFQIIRLVAVRYILAAFLRSIRNITFYSHPRSKWWSLGRGYALVATVSLFIRLPVPLLLGYTDRCSTANLTTICF